MNDFLRFNLPPRVIYVSQLIDQGPADMLQRALTAYLAQEQQHNDGRYAVIGCQLLHLCGWSTSAVVARGMVRALEAEPETSASPVVLRTAWPFDVSAWPAARVSDAGFGEMHLPPDLMDELRTKEARNALH